MGPEGWLELADRVRYLHGRGILGVTKEEGDNIVEALRLAAKSADEVPAAYRWRYNVDDREIRWTLRSTEVSGPDVVCEPLYLEAGVTNQAVKAWRSFMAQLIVKDADHPANITIVEQPIPARVFDAALAASLSTTEEPKR